MVRAFRRRVAVADKVRVFSQGARHARVYAPIMGCLALLGLSSCAPLNAPASNGEFKPANTRDADREGNVWQEPLEDAWLDKKESGDCRTALPLIETDEGVAVWSVTVDGLEATDALPFALPPEITRLPEGSLLKTPCQLLVVFEPSRSSLRLIAGKKTVNSLRLAERQKPSRSLERTVSKDIEAIEEDRNTQAFRTGDPLLDFVGTAAVGLLGLAGSVIDRVKESNLRDASEESERNAIESEPYSFKAAVVTARRSGLYRIAVIHSGGKGTYVTERWVQEEERFLVTPDLDRHDLGVQTELPLLDPSALIAWEAGMPTIPTADILEAASRASAAHSLREASSVRRHWSKGISQPVRLTGTTGIDPRPIDDDTEFSFDEFSSPPIGLAAQPLDAIVTLRHTEGEAMGVFVAPETVLTAEAWLPSGGLIEVVPNSGSSTFAVTRQRSEKLGLALLYVPQSRPILELAHSSDDAPAMAVIGKTKYPVNFTEVRGDGRTYRLLRFNDPTFRNTPLPGSPLMVSGALAGMVSSVDESGYRIASREAIASFIDRPTISSPPLPES